MRYIFVDHKTSRIIRVKEFSKMFCIDYGILLDNIWHTVRDISIDLLNNKTFIYVSND